MKTGLYTADHLALQDVYKFEYYSLQRNIRGKAKFNQVFEDHAPEKIRRLLVGEHSPYKYFWKLKKQKGQLGLKSFKHFLKQD